MSLFEDTNPRDLKELLGQIHAREAALPDFQRDFVWDPYMTQELIVSIACNYGSSGSFVETILEKWEDSPLQFCEEGEPWNPVRESSSRP